MVVVEKRTVRRDSTVLPSWRSRPIWFSTLVALLVSLYFQVRLGRFCVELQHGSGWRYFFFYWLVRRETGLKFITQNNPTVQFDTKRILDTNIKWPMNSDFTSVPCPKMYQYLVKKFSETKTGYVCMPRQIPMCAFISVTNFCLLALCNNSTCKRK